MGPSGWCSAAGSISSGLLTAWCTFQAGARIGFIYVSALVGLGHVGWGLELLLSCMYSASLTYAQEIQVPNSWEWYTSCASCSAYMGHVLPPQLTCLLNSFALPPGGFQQC